ncbi:MAG: hexokinase, partial [Actinobacteria bacterium]|nr:hexokinase [Actinomycetota bacterium]
FPTFIEYQNTLLKKQPVVVLDAGGTNLRSALVIFDKDKKPEIKNFKTVPMPGLKHEVSKDEFFKAIAASIKDIIGLSDKIGFVFSYPVKMFPDKDGMLVRFTKEIKAREVEGQFIGKNLIDTINKYGFSGKRVIILNDTVASLLAGISAFPERQYDSFANLILGTGMNASYIEKNSEIRKSDISNLNPDGYQIINIEAGNYGKGQRGEIDLKFNSKTLEPGMGTYEKMFSGAYLGGLAGEVIKFALEDGIFSKSFSEAFDNAFTFKSKDIDDYLYFPPRGSNMLKLLDTVDDTDRIRLYYIFDNLIERAAMLVSVVLASAVIKSNRGIDPCHPVCITAEGSSFYKMKNFQSRVYRHMQRIFGERGFYYYEINKVENAVLCGAAVAGLVG